MDAHTILMALERKYPHAALVPEVVLRDWDWLDRVEHHGATSSKPSRRIDALMFQSLERTAIEIKVNKSDFDKDGYVKRYPWQRICHRFVYVVPETLCDTVRSLVPDSCGLWTVTKIGTVSVAKKAKVCTTPEPLPQQVVQSLAYRAAHGR